MTLQQPSGSVDDPRFLDRFGLVLAFTVASVVLLSLVDLSDVRSDRVQQVVSVVTATLTVLALIMAMRAAGVRRRVRRLMEFAMVFGLLLSVVLIAFDSFRPAPEQSTFPPLLPLVLSILAPIVVVRRLLTHRRVSVSTLLGAVSVYLLIALAFFYAFLTVEVMQSGNFFGTPQPTSDLMYFSLSTITTVGYGDLVAVAQPGRLLANTEAVLGQLYLVTFVGFLIGVLTTQRRETEPSVVVDAPE